MFITCSSQSSSQIGTKKNPKSITTVGVFKFRRYEKGITFAFIWFNIRTNQQAKGIRVVQDNYERVKYLIVNLCKGKFPITAKP